MDLPPSGWYPDPYGAPDLLRWWDGLNWTRHTHPGVSAADSAGGATSGGGGTSGGGKHAADGGQQATTVEPAATGQPTTGQPATGQPTTGQPTTAQPGGGWAARDRVIGDWAGTDWPTGDQLATTKPPNGPRTEPQPALPDTSVQPSVQSSAPATRYQPAVQPTSTQPAVQPTTTQPAVQPTTYQAAVRPTTPQPATGQPGGGQQGGGTGVDGTQVMFLGGDAWQMPGGPADPGGPAQPNLYGYQEAQRRRRMWLIGGLSAGTAVAIAIIVVVATSMGGSPNATAADQTRVTTPPSPTASAAAPSPTTPASPSPSASAAPPAATLSDGQSGLSYSQLASPWASTCPTDLASAFAWSAGESAIAGQINGGQTPWYGEACSGPLPAQYNYSTVQDLANTATNVANTLEGAYYNALDHTATPVLSQPTSVSGHAGWEVEYLITYTNAAAQGATWTSEYGAVVVADTGDGNTPVVFFTSIPDTLGGQTTASSLVSSLQLSVVPNPSGSGADGSGPPDGSPGP
jgi:hypothetical protein